MDEEQVVTPTDAPTSDGTDSAPVEQNVDSAPQPQETTEQETPEVETPKEEKRNAQGRIQQLVAEKKKVQQERDQYAAQLQQQSQSEIPDEIDPNEYRAMQYNNTVVANELQTMKLERLADKLESSSAKIYTDYPDLKDSPLDEKLSQRWERDYAQKNANGEIIGYSMSPDNFVREQMELIESAKAEATAQNSQALQRQSSESAITPQTNQQSATKEFKDLSIEEMEKQLGVVRQ